MLLKYLKTQKLMSLATRGKDMWSASVYYLFDENFNLYFLSPPNSIHCRNISKNSQVSLSIADSGQKVSDNKIGFQMRGKAEKMRKVDTIKNIISMWNNNHKDAPPISFTSFMKAAKSRFYKITPLYIKLFSEINGKEKERSWSL